MMKPLSLVLAACLLLFVIFLGIPAAGQDRISQPEVKPMIVTIKSLNYDPKKLEIRAGDSVAWTNKAFSRHTATSDDEGKAFDTGDIPPDESSKAVKFDKVGEFKYHCTVHGKTMSGIILVKEREKK
jgi:plastocyanin